MSADLDRVCNGIRARLHDCADRLRDVGAGTGAFADPHAVDVAITMTMTVLEAAQAQLRRDVLGGSP